MRYKSSAIHTGAQAIPSRAGLGWGFLGVAAFSLTVPVTRLAAEAGVHPLVIGAGRAVLAALIAGCVLALTGSRRPRGGEWASLAVVAAGIVIGFPLLTSLALDSVPASHGAIVIAVLPAATAVAGVLRTGERPPLVFWLLSAAGAVAAIGFALLHGGGLGGFGRADLLLFGAVIAAGLGYAEGGLLARTLGSWQVVSWALVLAAPLMIVLTALPLTAPEVRAGLVSAGPAAWAALAYLSLVSMYLGFFAWYRGLAIGPLATVSQIQLIQPVLSLIWAALLLGERISLPTMLGGLIVIACTAATVRMRVQPVRPQARSRS